MTSPLPAGSTIGILGGGQLGRMLAMAAARLGYRTVILEPQSDCPAAQVANRHIAAAFDDTQALQDLAEVCDVVTYEFENVPLAAATTLASRVPVHPPPRALEASQDRVAEKQFLNGNGIATAAWTAVDDRAGLLAALAAFGGSGVLKTRRMGYDGKGQHLFRDAAPDEADAAFRTLGAQPLILESLDPFEREDSVIAARAADGTAVTYDPAENIHRDGILRRSTVPAGIDASIARAAQAQAVTIMEALSYVGVLGVEFFVLPGRELLVNEIAPRVHNSGHWTEAVCAVSQFEQHIRAICGLPLGSTSRLADCVMDNLIGEEVSTASALMAEPDTVLHLYGKAETRAGRKMGHVTRISPLSPLD